MAELLGLLVVLLLIIPIIAICVIVGLGAIPVILYRTWGKPDRSFPRELWRFNKKVLYVMLEAIGTAGTGL